MTIRKQLYNEKLVKVGIALRAIREKKGLTIAQFAEEVDLSDRTISNYELGKNYMTIESIVKITESPVCDFTLTEILDILIVQIFEDRY